MDVRGEDIQLEKGNFYLLHKSIDLAIIRAKLPVYEKDVIRAILHLTYGHKPRRAKAELGQEDIAEVSGISGSNVWTVLSKLIKMNIVTKEGGGRGRGKRAILGLNKYIEGWKVDFREPQGGQKNTSVDRYFAEEENTSNHRYLIEENTCDHSDFTEHKIPVTTDQNTSPDRYITSGPNTLIQKQSNTTKRTDGLADDAFSLMKESYQRLGKFGPPTSTQDGKEALALALRLVEDYGFEDCLREVSTLKERHDVMISKGEKGIKAPVSYLATILDKKAERATIPTPTDVPSNVVNFSIKDLET